MKGRIRVNLQLLSAYDKIFFDPVETAETAE